MVDIFDEVEEDLRAERAQKLLMRYGGAIVAAALAIICAVGGWQAWHWWQVKRDASAATAFIASIATAESSAPSAVALRPQILTRLTEIETAAPEGYRTLARLRAAALETDPATASAIWDKVAGDASADTVLRELASLLWAQHQLDKGDQAVIATRLQALAVPGATWRALAQEQLALLDLRQGRDGVAKAALRKLAEDVTAPAGVRGRASSMISKLGG